MSRRKLYFYALLAAILACATVGRLDRRLAELHAPETSGWAKAPPRTASFHPKSELLPADFLPIQSRNANNLGVGKLLVASRNLGDPQFAKTVILLVRYDAQGVLGIILNRRTHVPLSRALENLKAAKDRSDPVYLGGPVEMPAVFALFHSPAKLDGAEHVFDGVYLITAKADPRTNHFRSTRSWRFSRVSGLCRMESRATAARSRIGRLVHFSGGGQHGFQCQSEFLVVRNDSQDGTPVCAERATKCTFEPLQQRCSPLV